MRAILGIIFVLIISISPSIAQERCAPGSFILAGKWYCISGVKKCPYPHCALCRYVLVSGMPQLLCRGCSRCCIA
jgi:hypothetical protein